MKRIICPFCRFESKSFLSGGLKFPVLNRYKVLGAGFRKNKCCPNCGSNDRDRHLYLYLLLFTSLFSNEPKKVLHIAPEVCLLEKINKFPMATYYPADLKGRNGAKKIDIRKTQFKNDYFDFIICGHVLEHINEDEKALKELSRIIKKDGTIVLTVPYSKAIIKSIEGPTVTDSKERERQFGQHDHVRIYAEQDILNKLKRSNLKFRCISLPDELGHAFAKKFALLKNEKLFICYKRSIPS